MKLTYSKLEWDSNFFSYNVGSIEGKIKDVAALKELTSLIHSNQSKLSYFSSPEKLGDFVFESKELEILLVDKKVTYFKEIDPSLKIHPFVSPYENTLPEPKMLDLAIQSGIYSRFNVDKNIKKEKFEELYSLWIQNSLSREIAKEVLIFREQQEIAGFVTLGEKNSRADIGIIAVDGAFRGKGVGKALMKSAERWFSDKQYQTMQVVTQGDNIPACSLYESCGYRKESVEYFYHIWRNDPL